MTSNQGNVCWTQPRAGLASPRSMVILETKRLGVREVMGRSSESDFQVRPEVAALHEISLVLCGMFFCDAVPGLHRPTRPCRRGGKRAQRLVQRFATPMMPFISVSLAALAIAFGIF